jgi:hypothetical protein
MADLTVLDTGLSSNTSTILRPAPSGSRHRDGTLARGDVRQGCIFATARTAARFTSTAKGCQKSLDQQGIGQELGGHECQSRTS